MKQKMKTTVANILFKQWGILKYTLVISGVLSVIGTYIYNVEHGIPWYHCDALVGFWLGYAILFAVLVNLFLGVKWLMKWIKENKTVE